ncbi:MAG: HAMP domain-containing histidine kinase [Clostridium argentinense]|uniref:histidine kinase n=1 Tax=Clostridium faecium TaxID=2762223 RepID=A0ABR8YVX9_9CLOT|nr:MULTISPECIES: HAMP domain-containing sensor histidine kinase [Clostridium]MBD8048297.1 HAMP domain-containing histidine kinase [Clostridium faecium]MBS5823040.1 HAMP domain-containing histidine kinase [Clostridium argentinense]MDU1349200.1 HAMP domain-containing sensor histidine kinase [Clostridium argentinense]
MSKESIGLIVILLVVIIFFIYREWKYHCRIKEILIILEDIIEGRENRKIHVNPNETIAPLVFKINQLVDSYQKDKVKAFRAEQVRKQMLSNLSHDVRTPLTSVLGYLDALCDGMAGEESEEYLHIAKNKAYALKEYIDELFTVAQIDANEIQLVFEPIDLFELLRSELIGWIPRLQKENIDLEVKIPDEECFINGDEHAVIRIFNNLLQNAFRYGKDNHFIGVIAWSDDTNVYFQVWDKGPGISSDEISKVFERLYREDSSRSTKGHGLGLAISKELVHKMQGKIFMESNPYIKTFVQVSLPKSKKK